jgi:hypothetical protein
MKRLLLIAGATLVLAGCATTSTNSEGVALADAWSGLNAASIAADAAVHAGALHGANAAKVSADLKDAAAVLTAATAAYKANEADPSVSGYVAQAIADLTAITAIVEPAK